LVIAIFFVFSGMGYSQTAHVSGPRIDTGKNVISNTGQVLEWKRFVSLLKALEVNKKGNVTIVHLGDSHIQGGYFPNRFRELLNHGYGISGRGWVFPDSYAGVNGPEDVKFRSKSRWESERYTQLSDAKEANISGYHLVTADSVIRIMMKLKLKSDSLFPFNELILYHNKNLLVLDEHEGISSIEEHESENFSTTRFVFHGFVDSVNLRFSLKKADQKKFSLLGIDLVSSKPGIVYHSIGVNGADFDAYNRMINYRPVLRQLHPDLVILSLGTNDAFVPHIDGNRFKQRVISLIDSIQLLLPGTCILLTTPGDHLRNRKFQNPNLIIVRDAIVSAAVQKNCLYWDFLDIMGGIGSSKRWRANGYMYGDMKHLSQEGYFRQGELFFDAFKKAINQTMLHGTD
jgi:lysophospholipase L1-like esterase